MKKQIELFTQATPRFSIARKKWPPSGLRDRGRSLETARPVTIVFEPKAHIAVPGRGRARTAI